MKKSRFKMFQSSGKLVTTIYVSAQIVIIVTMLGSILATLFTQEHSLSQMFSHLALCILALLLMNFPIVTQKRYNVKIPDFMLIIIAIFIVAHFIFGEVYRAYDHIILFDKILHCTSGVIIAMLGFSLVNFLNDRQNESIKLSPFFIALFAFCFALALGVVWEIFEYSVDSIIGANMQRWKDDIEKVVINGKEQYAIVGFKQPNAIIDTMEDLIVSTIGTFIVCIFGFIWLKKGSPKINRILIMRTDKPREELSSSKTSTTK